MEKKISVILAICLLTGVVSGCGNTGTEMLSSTDVTEEKSNLRDGENQEETASDEPVEDNVIDLTDYSSYLKKIWIEKEWNSEDHGWSDSLVITQIENGYIEGYYGSVRDDYFNLSVGQDGLYPFAGEIFDGIAECEYEYIDGRNKPLTITFFNNDYIMVEPDGDANRSNLFRPYHVSDWQFRGEPVSYEAELDSWGTVTLFYANLADRHSYPWVLLLDDQGDILYKFPGRFRIDSEVSEVVIEDVNGDGLKDVEVVTSWKGTDEDRMEWIFCQMDDGLFCLEKCSGNDATDIPPFLTFDWTAQEVLFHSIQPEDSARGWVFSLADVDFDGCMEVLITFTAMHCGGNSLYIYKQDEGKVISLVDTYATFREDVTWLSQGYGSLSPYLDIDLLDAYVNGEGEYRYLSLDYTLFGGFGELLLYVTTLEQDAQPVKLAEIQFYENESSEEMEIYFQEERVYEPEELHELLEQYMTGYKKVEMEFKISNCFQRDIVAFNENKKRQCLEDLYESMEEYLDWEQDYLLSLVEPEEKRQTIQGILEKEGSQLVRLVMNRLEGLDCCLFETSTGQGLEFHLLLWGSWEGEEIQQYQVLSLNEKGHFTLEQLSEWCEVQKEDIDFDGEPDLLIYEGQSHGAKNSFDHYRVMRWDKVQRQFVYYPSFPFWITFMNLEDKQVIYKAKGGLSDRIVRVYGVVEGEYRVIQEMKMSTESVPEEYIGKTSTSWLEILSYYENGELVREYDVTGMSWDEMEKLFQKEGLSEIYSYTRDYG